MSKWLINPEKKQYYSDDISVIKTEEEIFNLKVAYEIKRLLEKNGETVLLTRSTNTYVETKEKIQLTKEWKPDFIVTLNIKENNKGECGTEVYINRKGSYSEDLAKFIKSEMLSNLRTIDRGVIEIKDELLESLEIPAIIISGEYKDENKEDLNAIALKYGKVISKGALRIVNKVLIDIPIKKPKFPKREGWRICLGYYKDYEEAEFDIIKFKNVGAKEVYIVPYPESNE